MKRITAIALLLMAGQLLAFGQSKSLSAIHSQLPEQQVRSAEAMLWRAYSAHDTSQLAQTLADDLSFTKENGYISNKATELRVQANLQQSRSKHLSGVSNSAIANFNYQVRSVRVYGDSAVTLGSFQEQDTNGKFVRFHFTNTWLKSGDKWQVVAIQLSTVSSEVIHMLDKMPKP